MARLAGGAVGLYNESSERLVRILIFRSSFEYEAVRKEAHIEEAVEARAEDKDVLRVLGCERPRVALCELFRVERSVGDERRRWNGVGLEVRLSNGLAVSVVLGHSKGIG